MTTTAAATEAAAATKAAAIATETAASAKNLNALLNLPAQMELSQMELIYRAEGNANLVLALPQFKKVLRLPKMISSRPTKRRPECSSDSCQPDVEASVSDPAKASSAKAGVLTMPDFMAYIEIMRRLLGNEFVCAADIVAIPKESDRFWINEHIRAHRPVARLDKEFVGPFGLLLPDVTQLPATFDVLLANLQAKDMNTDTNSNTDADSSRCPGIARLGDTYAIEIKPKQGWLQLPSDVSDLFDLMPLDTTVADPSELRPVRVQQLTSDAHRCRCRYCSMQLLKLQANKIGRLGDYCPMQLFSGSPRRMLDALNALFACPQNNLRVFQSGNLIYGDHANSISCDELHTRVFPGEIMALIKQLLVACLLREYNNELAKEDVQTRRSQTGSHVAAFGESTAEPCGTETKATETTEIGVANVDAAAAWHVDQKQQQDKVAAKVEDENEAAIVERVKAVAGQPQRRATRAAAEKTSQRYTKRSKITTTTKATTTTTAAAAAAKEIERLTTTNVASTWMSANVAMAAARTEMETETLATKTTTTTATATTTTTATATTTTPNPNETQALISKAEIFHLPKNCVLQKILHLQLLVKRHFHYMWQAGFAAHATPTYKALRSLLSCQAEQQERVDELPAEQAYLLGATALDCSIMLTFQEIRCPSRHNSELQPWLVAVQGRQFLTKLSVLDLDPKPDSHYHKFIEHTRQIEKRCRALN